jgi:hypothetical protein
MVARSTDGVGGFAALSSAALEPHQTPLVFEGRAKRRVLFSVWLTIRA